MIKFLLKLALSAIIASATWQIGSAFAANYRFKDATEAAALTPRISDDDLRARIMELAAQNDAPIEEDGLQIRREKNHIFIDASYVRPVNVLPGYQRAWPFAWSLDVFVLSQ